MNSHRIRPGAWLLSLLLAFLVLSAPARAQSKGFVWERFDVQFEILPDGSFWVRETNQIRSSAGTFTFGFREIPLDRVEEIRDVRVYEEGRPLQPSSVKRPGTYQVDETGDLLKVQWTFSSPLPEGARRTFVLEYRVIGGLRIYPDGDQLWWKAVYADRPFPVEGSRISVLFPQEVDYGQLKWATYGQEAREGHFTGRELVLEVQGEVPAGQEVEVRVQFPHGLVTADPPAWQEAEDAARAAQEAREAREAALRPILALLSLLALFGGLALLILGAFGLYVLWERKGKDVPVEEVAEILTEPPDDLPAPLVGVLLDGRVDGKEMVAILLDLGRKGVLEVPQVDKGRVRVRLLEPDRATTAYEQVFLRALFSSASTPGVEVSLSSLRARVHRRLPELYGSLYAVAAEEGLFEGRPDRVRRRVRIAGLALFFLAMPAWFGLRTLHPAGLHLHRVSWSFVPFLSLTLLGLGLAFLSSHLPRRTLKGARAAARWRAFQRYLRTLKDREGLLTAARRLERVLPYAVALGVDRTLLRRLRRVEVPSSLIPEAWPTWYRYGRGGAPQEGKGTATASGMGRPAAPDLEDGSQLLAADLDRMSRELSTLLAQAARTFRRPTASGRRTGVRGARSVGGGLRRSGGGFRGGRGGAGGGGRGGFR